MSEKLTTWSKYFCEVCNATIVKYRSKPIPTCLGEVKCNIMRMISKKKNKIDYYNQSSSPSATNQVGERKMKKEG